MLRKLLLGLALAGVVVGAVLLVRGGRHHQARPSTTATTAATTAPTGTIGVEAYFYRGAGLVPVTVRVPRTKAVATAALRVLLAGPPTGYRTAIPAGTTLGDVAIGRGVATAAFSRIVSAPRSAKAQIVYTLTQFPSIRAVLLKDRSWTEYTTERRSDYADLTPNALIFVASPLRDSTVSSPVRVSGTAVAFEATIALEIWSGQKLLRRSTLTASAGAPERGTWSQTLDLTPGSYRLVLYEPSAENGTHLHTTTVDFRVES
jgi:hypothetical protein